MQRPELQLASVHSAQLAAPGCCIAATDGQEVCVAASSSALLSLHLPSGSVDTIPLSNSVKALGCLAFSPTARCVAVGETGFKPAVFVSFQGATSPPLALRAHNFGIQAVAWSPQGTLLASTGVEKDRQLILWHPLSGAQLGRARLEEDYQALEWVDDRTLCAVNSEAFMVYVLEKTVSIGRTQQYKLIPKRHPLSLPTDRAGSSSNKVQPRVVSMVATQPVVGAPRRLWAALDSGHVLALRSASGKCDRVLDTKVGRLVHMTACPQYVACASAGGEIKVFLAASLEEVATLTCPNLPADYPLPPAAVSCAFSPDGSQLAALFANGMLCSWRCSCEGLEAAPLGGTTFHSSPIVDAALLRCSGQQYVASCGQDGKVQLLQLEGGKLSKAVTVDLRVLQPELRGVRLSSIAPSPDGSLLAAGDTMGGIHAFAASLGSLDYLCSVEGQGSEVTACAFAPPMSSGSQRYQLLAVGTQAGTLTLLDAMQDFAVVAQLQQASQGMVSLMWAQQQGSQLLAASRDGKVSAYSVRLVQEGRVSLSLDVLTSFCPALPKPPLVASHTAVWGQVAVACGRDGSSVRIFDAVSGDDLVSVPLEVGKTAGEATSMAVDEGICIVALATNKNMLQLHDRRNGKLLLASKSHLAGTAVTRVLITPDADSIVTAGQDGSVRVWAVPEELRLECQAEQERLRATVDNVAEELPPPSSLPSPSLLSEDSSLLRPQNLFDEDTAMSLPTPGDFLDLAEAALFGLAATAGGSGVGEEAELPSIDNGSIGARAAGPQEDEDAEHQQTSQLPRPARNQSMGGLNRQFGELQAQFEALKASPGRRQVADETGSEQVTAQDATAQSVPQPQASPVLPASSGLSLAEYLRSPRGSIGGLSQPGLEASQLGSASSGLGLQRTASRHQPWLSPREGSGLWVSLSGEEDEIAAAEAQRCKALLRCSEAEPEAQQAAAPSPADAEMQQAVASPPAAAAAGGAATAVACPESVGSVPAAGRQARRGTWALGPNGGASAAPRRPLSALGAPVAAVRTEPNAPRPATAQGIESSPPPSEEDFTCWSDPSSPAASGSKRQSFSFNMAGAAAAKGAQAAGAPFPCAPEASTPSWGFKTAVSKHPHPTPASISKPLFHSPASKPPGSSGTGAAAAAGTAAECAVQQSSGGLKNRPPVPRLNLPLPAPGAEEGAPSPTAVGEYEELPEPAQHSGSRGSYATASSSDSGGSGHSSDRSSSEGSVGSMGQARSEDGDVFDSPLPSMAPTGQLRAASAEEHEGTPFSPPTLHHNQLFDSPFHSTASPSSPPAQHVSFQAARQQPASDMGLTQRSIASDGDSDLSAFDRPPAYDPLSPDRHSSSQGTQDEVAKELFDGESKSQAGSPFSSPDTALEVLPGVDMASNPAFALSPDTLSPLAGPAMRRMSACMPDAAGTAPPAIVGKASSPSLPAAGAASGAKPAAADMTVTPEGVLAMFSQAVAALKALQAEGKVEAGFMQQLAQLGISVQGVCGSGGKASPGDSEPSQGSHRPPRGEAGDTPNSGRLSVLSVEDRAVLMEGIKEEILSELRREILMGALKA